MKPFLVTLLLSVLIALIAGYFGRKHNQKIVENALSEQVGKSGVLDEPRFANVDLSFDHLTGKVSGTVGSQEDADDLVAGVRNHIDGGRLLSNLKVEIPKTKPFLEIAQSGGAITLNGEVESDSAISAISDALPKGSQGIENKLKVGAQTLALPAVVLPAIRSVFPASKNATLKLQDGELKISGDLVRPANKESILAQLRDHSGARVSFDGLNDPPKLPAAFSLSSTDGAEGSSTLSLAGLLPTNEARNRILSAARTAAGDDIKIDAEQLRVESDVEAPSWIGNLSGVVGSLISGAKDPSLQVGGNAFQVGGVTDTAPLAESLLASLRGLSGSSAIQNNLQVAPPPAPVVVPQVKPAPQPKQPALVSIGGNRRSLEFSGKLPNKAVQDQVLASLEGLDSKPTVANKSSVNPQIESPSWLGELPKAIGAFFKSPVVDPAFAIGQERLVLRGQLRNPRAKDRILNQLAPLRDQGVTIVDRLTVVSPAPSKPVVAAVTAPAPKPAMPAAPVPVKPKPVQPDPKPVKDPPAVEIKEGLITVHFDTNSSYLRKSDTQAIQNALQLAKQQGAKVDLYGFADYRGDTEYNQWLSDRRVNRIRDSLLDAGLQPEKVRSTIGKGELPYEKGKLNRSEALQQHRKVEIRIQK